MTSLTTDRFRQAFSSLPDDVKQRAKNAFLIWKENPAHPGLRFKQIKGSEQVYSVRIGLNWRALAVKEGDAFIWFWIGSHDDYINMLSRI